MRKVGSDIYLQQKAKIRARVRKEIGQSSPPTVGSLNFGCLSYICILCIKCIMHVFSEHIWEAVKKVSLGKVFPNVWTHPPTPGFREIWENERWNLGQKRRLSGWFFFFKGLDLVWESATPPTHIWEKISRKKSYFRPLLISFFTRSQG